jgi:predicted  nucleic acid-binding Zn-ribbon protein
MMPVQADHTTQLRLLDLQATDTMLAQLEHRRRSLPEIAALAQRNEQESVLVDELFDAQTRASDVADEQRRLENEVDTVRARASRDEQRMQSGGLPGKELEGLQLELVTLARRQSSLEDQLLEVMEEREQVDAAVAELGGRRSALDADITGLTTARDAALADIEAAVADRSKERAAIAGEMPADLLGLYERAREHGGGVGAAMLRQRRCEGCHIELSGSELSAVRAAAPDEVVRCENCRRILVRTDESGL